MGEVVSLIPTPASVDAAWERFRALSAASIDRPALLLDRNHLQNLARAERDFKRVFLAADQGKLANASVPRT